MVPPARATSQVTADTGDGAAARLRAWCWAPEARAWNAAWCAVVVLAVAAVGVAAFVVPRVARPAAHPTLHFFPELTAAVNPEPVEQAQMLVVLVAAGVAAPLAWVLHRSRVPHAALAWAPSAGLVGCVAVGITAWVRDPTRGMILGFVTAPWVAVAAAGAVACGVVLARLRPRPRGEAPHRPRLGVDAAVAVAALVVGASFLASAFYRDDTIGLAPLATYGHAWFTYTEALAVTFGRTPLVDFVPQYTALVPWLLAPWFAVAGNTMAAFTGGMIALGFVALGGLYVGLRLMTRNPLAAGVIFVVTLAVGAFPPARAGDEVHGILQYYALMPYRYLGPLALFAVSQWALRRPDSPRRLVPLGVGSGAALLVNVEFGVFAALAALVVAASSRTASGRRPGAAHVIVRAAWWTAGTLAAIMVFGAATLIRSGSLPDLAGVVYFNRQFAQSGFFMLPLESYWGVHLLVLGSILAALVTGLCVTVLSGAAPARRLADGAAGLTYIGIAGLGPCVLFMGRSHPLVLVGAFLAWALALAALVWFAAVAIRSGVVRARLVTPGAAVAFGLALLLALPIARQDGFALTQVSRLTSATTGPDIYRLDAQIAMARACIPPGSGIVVLVPFPDRIAHAVGSRNHLPYNDSTSIVTQEQVDRLLGAMARHDVSFVFEHHAFLSLQIALLRAGYQPVRQARLPSGADTFRVWTNPAGTARLRCTGKQMQAAADSG